MLKTLTLRGSSSGPHLLITSGVHGDEYEPMEAARKVFSKVKKIQGKLKGSLTVVPVVNRPAFERLSRTGPDQLDLARVCPGNKNGTETERIADKVSELIRTADYYIDMHSGGHLHNIYPFCGYMLHSDKSTLQTQRELASSFLLPIVWGTDPDMQGRTLSIARDTKIPAIYTEIGGAGAYDSAMTKLTVDGCINVLKYLKMIPGKPKKGNVKYHLEDYRRESGHLQKMLPSPIDGFFIPNVTFGQSVRKGQIIGHVQDDLGKESTSIRADQSGVVFILRNPPAVKKGDALGAILPAQDVNKIQKTYE